MNRIKQFSAIFLTVMILILVVSCTKNPNQSGESQMERNNQVSLLVSAGAGFMDAMNDIKELYGKEHPNVSITYNFASSGSLQQQIENGANVDVFLSAAQKQMNVLEEKGLIEMTTRKNLVGNSIVVVVPLESNLDISFEELGGDKISKFAMGEPKSVPAGQYAQEVLDKFNMAENVKSKVVYGKSVKEVLSWVETGNVDAGVVYETDAKVSQKVRKVAEAPTGSHRPIECPVSVIKTSKNKEDAKRFIEFLSSEKSKVIFEKYGYRFLAES